MGQNSSEIGGAAPSRRVSFQPDDTGRQFASQLPRMRVRGWVAASLFASGCIVQPDYSGAGGVLTCKDGSTCPGSLVCVEKLCVEPPGPVSGLPGSEDPEGPTAPVVGSPDAAPVRTASPDAALPDLGDGGIAAVCGARFGNLPGYQLCDASDSRNLLRTVDGVTVQYSGALCEFAAQTGGINGPGNCADLCGTAGSMCVTGSGNSDAAPCEPIVNHPCDYNVQTEICLCPP